MGLPRDSLPHRYWQRPHRPAAALAMATRGTLVHFSLPVTVVEELQCAGQGKAVRKLRGKRLRQLQPLPQTLRAWALLQLDGTPRVCRAASARLAGAAKNKSFREKVWHEDRRWQPPGYMCVRCVVGRSAFSLRKILQRSE